MFLKQMFASRANMLVLRTSDFQGATIRPTELSETCCFGLRKTVKAVLAKIYWTKNVKLELVFLYVSSNAMQIKGPNGITQVACVAGVRKGEKRERRALAREDRTREDRAHFDFSPFYGLSRRATTQVPGPKNCFCSYYRKGKDERWREEDRPREDRAHFDFPPFYGLLRKATTQVPCPKNSLCSYCRKGKDERWREKI